MNGDGKEKGLANNSSQASQRGDAEKGFMETLGRGFSDMYRNSSEEMILKSLMENPMGLSSAPSLEMLGLKNISQTLREDSEELFNSWLMNGEIPGFGCTTTAPRARQASRRISTELAVSSHLNGVAYQKKSNNVNLYQQNLSTVEEYSNDTSQPSLRNAAEKGLQASNLYLAKAWFHSTQPMTRSRSSELRRRYAAMQNLQTPMIVEAPNNTHVRDTNKMEQEFGNTSNFCDIPVGEMSNQLQTFMSPSNSSSSHFNTSPMANVDTVSSVVSMLKGTLERKKLSNQADKKENHFFNFQEVPSNISSNQDAANQIIEPPINFHGLSTIQLKDSANSSIVERSAELNMEGYAAPANQIQWGTVSQEPSQSESSAAAPVLSTGFEVCDGPANSGQTLSVCESSRKHIGNGSSEHESKTRVHKNTSTSAAVQEFRERIYENNLKNVRKKGSLVRVGSISSGCSVDKSDPTKKRRVERSRKMAEAKERNSIPTLPSDMQSVLKRCDTLEKEVRSLKLNLSFMNRKDSEQTKQIEDLQKQNDELAEEKERLLEEIERIISESGKM